MGMTLMSKTEVDSRVAAVGGMCRSAMSCWSHAGRGASITVCRSGGARFRCAFDEVDTAGPVSVVLDWVNADEVEGALAYGAADPVTTSSGSCV